jgi:hydroxymethylpyrimidine pyrophosphatase-like HAD family hydrolase
LDGTLIHHKDEKNIIYDDVIEQLHKSIEGKHFSIATGRHYKDVLSIVEKHNILMPKNSYIVGANGCQIYSIDSKKLLLDKILDDEIIQIELPKIM